MPCLVVIYNIYYIVFSIFYLLQVHVSFYDGGIMSITTISKKELIFPYLRSDAGLGFVFSIYHSKIPKANPLNIRVDFPVYLSSTPFVSKSNFEFRYIIGINKIL
jgi:hypothetical protein